MTDSNLRPSQIPTKDNWPSEVCHEATEVGAVLFSFVDDCSICGKAPAEVGGLCVGCDHLMGDVLIDWGEN